MTYLIKESTKDDNNIINDFNRDLIKRGITHELPLPNFENLEKNNVIVKNNFILVENKTTVRAGYTLKNQWFKINDDLLQIGYYYNPVSSGIFNKKYNICGLMLLNDAQKKNPNLFSLGMGGYSEPLPKFLKGLKWDLRKVPFFFKIYRPSSFLKNIQYLKNTKIKSFIINIIDKSGLGWLCITALFQIISLLKNRFVRNAKIIVKEINDFDKNFDIIWDAAKQEKSFSAVRNSDYLKILYSDKKFIKLKFIEKDKIVGWSISLCTNLNNHKYFGMMRLGSIVDCLSLKGYETTIIHETCKKLKMENVDLVVSNQSHIFWKNAFKMNSFIKGPSNFIFAASKNLANKINNEKKSKNFMHITRGDGDGPINL